MRLEPKTKADSPPASRFETPQNGPVKDINLYCIRVYLLVGCKGIYFVTRLPTRTAHFVRDLLAFGKKKKNVYFRL